MQAYQYADREYFKGLDEQATEELSVESNLLDVWAQIASNDTATMKKVFSEMNSYKSYDATMITMRLLANPDSALNDSAIRSVWHELINNTILAMVKEKANDKTFEMERFA